MNIETLKGMANNKLSWRERIKAIKQLEKMDCQQSADVLKRLALVRSEKVYKVKEAAFRACQARQ